MQRESEADDSNGIRLRGGPASHACAGASAAHDQGMLGPFLLDQPAQRGKPGFVQSRWWCTHGAPGRTPGLLKSHHGRTQCRKTSGQQLKISSAHAATCAMAEHQDRARALG
jgi:hypothetical protein